MTVLFLPLVSFLKHCMNISLSRMAMNKSVGYGMRRGVKEQKNLMLWPQSTPREEEDTMLGCRVSYRFSSVSIYEKLIDLICNAKKTLIK